MGCLRGPGVTLTPSKCNNIYIRAQHSGEGLGIYGAYQRGLGARVPSGRLRELTLCPPSVPPGCLLVTTTGPRGSCFLPPPALPSSPKYRSHLVTAASITLALLIHYRLIKRAARVQNRGHECACNAAHGGYTV